MGNDVVSKWIGAASCKQRYTPRDKLRGTRLAESVTEAGENERY